MAERGYIIHAKNERLEGITRDNIQLLIFLGVASLSVTVNVKFESFILIFSNLPV